MSDTLRDDAFFEEIAARTDSHRSGQGNAPAELKSSIVAKLMAQSESAGDPLFERLAAVDERHAAPSRLKCRIYSALIARQQETGPLLSLTETWRAGRALCVFEELVRIAPAGEKLQSFNYCRVCHARVLAEHLQKAPIYWPHCPYAEFQGR